MDCSDAAHRIHPLAGMGLNLGFGDVKCLTEALAKAAYSGFSLGELAYMILLYISSMLYEYILLNSFIVVHLKAISPI